MVSKEKFNKNGYAISFGKANLYTFFFMFFTFVTFMLFFEKIRDKGIDSIEFDSIKRSFLYVFVLGVIVHELLHGLTWSLYTKKGLQSIKFGFKWKSLTPYCHCMELIRVKHYRLGIVMPLLFLGLLPCIYSIIVNNGVIFFYSVVFICISAGDLLILLMLRRFGNEEFLRDHPTKMGFYIEEGYSSID